jgi:CBS domain containing-hemolysin-like protein
MVRLAIILVFALWSVWVLFETWRERSLRVLVLLAVGAGAAVILGGLHGLISLGPKGPVWVGLWVLSIAGFVVGRSLAGRVAFPKQLDWLMGPVDAVGTLVNDLHQGRLRKRQSPEPTSVRAATAREEALETVLDLGSMSVDEVMISRSEMDALESDEAVEDWIRLMVTKNRRRFPVYKENHDNILGVVSFRELMASESLNDHLGKYARPVAFVPETMKCDDLLRQLWAAGEHLAIVVDEYGGVAGMVAREDLLEILVGDLLEEPDHNGARILRVDEKTWLADGHYRIADFNERFNVTLPEGEYETLSGLFLERLGRIPREGERLEFSQAVLEVAARDDRRIKSLRVQLPVRPRRSRSEESVSTEPSKEP